MGWARQFDQFENVSVWIAAINRFRAAKILRWIMKGYARRLQPLVLFLQVGDFETDVVDPRVVDRLHRIGHLAPRTLKFPQFELHVAQSQHRAFGLNLLQAKDVVVEHVVINLGHLPQQFHAEQVAIEANAPLDVAGRNTDMIDGFESGSRWRPGRIRQQEHGPKPQAHQTCSNHHRSP